MIHFNLLKWHCYHSTVYSILVNIYTYIIYCFSNKTGIGLPKYQDNVSHVKELYCVGTILHCSLIWFRTDISLLTTCLTCDNATVISSALLSH